jgi:hypothetical protein
MTTKAASNQKVTLFNALNTLADEIVQEKTAAAQTKSAAPTPSDPGGYQGASSHPTTSIDNRGQTAQEGARSSENTSDVKSDQPVGVDQTSEATPGQDEQDGQQLNIGTQQSATGEDPSVEDAYKGTKDDPGTSHPAKTEDGEKYSSFKEANAKATSLANEILADIANGFGDQLTKASSDDDNEDSWEGDSHSNDPKSRPGTDAPMTPAGGSAEGEHVEPGGGEAKAASDGSGKTNVDPELLKSAAAKATEPAPAPVAAGYELASALGIEKAAAEAGVQECIAETIKDAHLDADLFGTYFVSLANRLQKEAMGDPMEGEEGEDHSEPGDEASGASDAAPDEGGGEEGGLGDLLGGGEMGGDPMGGDPMAGGMGEPSQEEAVMQLAAALDELGIRPEDLAGAAGGGEMGGMPPGPEGGMPPMGGEAGGPPPGMEVMAAHKQAAMVERQKLAHAVNNFKRSGKYQLKAAQTPAQRQLRDTMRDYVTELMAV